MARIQLDPGAASFQGPEFMPLGLSGRFIHTIEAAPSRAVQFEFKNGNEALHAAHKRLQQEMGEPLGSGCALVLLVYFGRVHKSLRMTPAMAAGIADHIWSVRELLAST